MTSAVPFKMKRDCQKVNRLICRALNGEEVAEFEEITRSAISQGYGSVDKLVKIIIEIDTSVRLGYTSAAAGHDAKKSIVELIARTAGYHVFQPMDHGDTITDVLEMTTRVLKRAGELVEKMSEAISPNGECGANLSENEKRDIKDQAEICMSLMKTIQDYV